jgi:signal transduction histidine kinase
LRRLGGGFTSGSMITAAVLWWVSPGQFNRGGNGLQSLHHRASQLNGEIVIESSPGNGTTIDLDVPLYYSSYSQKRAKTT